MCREQGGDKKKNNMKHVIMLPISFLQKLLGLVGYANKPGGGPKLQTASGLIHHRHHIM